jgi:hypothetical protein
MIGRHLHNRTSYAADFTWDESDVRLPGQADPRQGQPGLDATFGLDAAVQDAGTAGCLVDRDAQGGSRAGEMIG